MKKFAILLMALLPLGLLSACSDDDEPKPENPKEDNPVYSIPEEDFISKVSDIVWILPDEEGNVQGYYSDGTEVEDQLAWPEGGQLFHDLKFENGKLVLYWRPWGNLIPELYGNRYDYEFDESTGVIYVDGKKKYRIEDLKDGRLYLTDYVGIFAMPQYDEKGEIIDHKRDEDSYATYSLRQATEEEAALYNIK